MACTKRIVAHMNQLRGEGCNSIKYPPSLVACAKYSRFKFYLTNQSIYFFELFSTLEWFLMSWAYSHFWQNNLAWCDDCINIYLYYSTEDKEGVNCNETWYIYLNPLSPDLVLCLILISICLNILV